MNEFTLMLLVAAVALVMLIVVHLRAQRARTGLYAQARAEAVRIDCERQAQYEAESEQLRRAIYLESVYGVDDGYDYCGNDYHDEADVTPPVTSKYYWFTGECIYEVCPDGSGLILLRDELFGNIVLDQGNGVYFIQIDAELVWLAEQYVEEGNLEVAA